MKELRGSLKRTLVSILKPQSHHAVNTGNKGAKGRKDTMCFREGKHCPSLRVLTQSLFINKTQRILHRLDAVPPLYCVFRIALPCAVVV